MNELKSGYIDIHTHILPGVDDGAKDIDMTSKMLQIAYEQGVRSIIATPHFQLGKKVTKEDLTVAYKKVQQEIESLGLDINLYLGNEIMYQEGCLEAVKDGSALTLAGSRYVLIEFGYEVSYKTIYRGMQQFIQAGYLPIIAHVERYSALRKKENYINDLIELGCYIQMNGKSLMGGPFNKFSSWCKHLVKNGYVHFIASDCHNETERPPMLGDCINRFEKRKDDYELCRLTINHPSYIINNQVL